MQVMKHVMKHTYKEEINKDEPCNTNYLRSVHTTPQLHCGADILITSLPQVTATSLHFKLK